MKNNKANSPELTASRKQEHLDLCLNENVESLKRGGWDTFTLPHCALPDLDYQKIETEVEFLGHKLASPLFISSMTGGSADADEYNLRLARLAQEKNIAMGVGSQRVLLENRETASFSLRKEAPKAFLMANIGAVQLNYGVTPDDCQWLVDKLEAQALILHLNPLQECIQKEGDRNFEGLWPKIEKLCSKLSVPVVLKETGCGLDRQSCAKAIEAGVSALDSAGLGGSHWGYIEGLRDESQRELGSVFRDWGIPSREALEIAVEVSDGRVPVLASGGIRSGLDLAKALYLGARMGGMALPFIKAAKEGDTKLEQLYDQELEALKVAMFCCSSKNLNDLKRKNRND